MAPPPRTARQPLPTGREYGPHDVRRECTDRQHQARMDLMAVVSTDMQSASRPLQAY